MCSHKQCIIRHLGKDPAEEWLVEEEPLGDYLEVEGFDEEDEEYFGEHQHYLLGAHLDFV